VDPTHNAFASHPLQTGSVRPDGSCSADKGGPDPQALSGSLCFPSRPGSQPVPHPIYHAYPVDAQDVSRASLTALVSCFTGGPYTAADPPQAAPPEHFRLSNNGMRTGSCVNRISTQFTFVLRARAFVSRRTRASRLGAPSASPQWPTWAVRCRPATSCPCSFRTPFRTRGSRR
jgi:hypothetical protein